MYRHIILIDYVCIGLKINFVFLFLFMLTHCVVYDNRYIAAQAWLLRAYVKG